MGPAILARADVAPFAAKIHGSALEYTVKPHPRFLPYAREGMEAAAGVLVGSRHTAESLWAALPDVPGSRRRRGSGRRGSTSRRFGRGTGGRVQRARVRVPAARPRHPRRVVFVGKLIVSKGVDLLLAAWPLVRAEHPEARLRGRRLRRVRGRGCGGCWRRWSAGDLDDAREVAPARAGRSRAGRRSRCRSSPPSSPIRPPATSRRREAAAGSVEFIGRLEHDEVAELLPRRRGAGDAEHLPRGVRDGRGEAAACGALPVSAGHSGMLEVSRQLPRRCPREVGGADLVPGRGGCGRGDRRAARTAGWRCRRPSARRRARRLVETARRLWSWEGVARGVLAAAAGSSTVCPPA